MKKLLSILVIWAVALSAMAHTYTNKSVLSTGNWVKIRVSESGVHRLSYDDIRNAGLNPANVRVYGYGGAILPREFSKYHIDDLCPVALYDTGDAILFYAHGHSEWSYNGSHFVHTRNTYSNYGYYFLSDNAGERLLMANDTTNWAAAGATTNVTTYLRLWLHEQDIVNLVDPTGVAGGGKNFYGENFTEQTPTRTFTISAPNLAKTSVYINCNLAQKAYYANRFTVEAGSSQYTGYLSAIDQSDHYTKGTAGKVANTYNQVSSNPIVTITYNGKNGSIGYLDYIEAEAECQLQMYGDQMDIRSRTNYQSTTPNHYVLTTDGQSTVEVWNVTDKENHYRVATAPAGTTTAEWTGSNRNEIQHYIAVKPYATLLQPTVVGSIRNQNLHAMQQADLVIITPEKWRSQADSLAHLHENDSTNPMTTWVVTDQEVYNEFSSGTPDATAYRWVMKMLYDRHGGSTGVNRPKYLLLFGDGTFDNRKLLFASGQNNLLTYQADNSLNEVKAYATDDYFGFLNDDEGASDTRGTMDIGVGRLPINTDQDANNMVEKIRRYIYESNLRNWKQQIVFLADDGDNGLHTETSEKGAERLFNRNKDFVLNKIYLDSYQQEVTASGESYPIAKNRFTNLLQNGMLYFNYSGHGGYNNITNEGMMSQQDAQKLTNANQGFWMLATCSFAHFDCGRESTAETAVLNPNGGAIAVMSADRTVYASQNEKLNTNLCDTLFAHRDVFNYNMTLGEAVRCAKNKTGVDENKLAYVLLGDPALRLAFPTQLHVNTTQRSDTMRAMSVQEIHGEIVNEDGERDTIFYGKVHVTIYDKQQLITTQDNDEKDPNKRKTLTYKDYPNILYTGECAVDSGCFHMQFMMPKDIRYNYGNGRIVYYAYDDTLRSEAIGHDESFIIGGSNNEQFVDTVGPEIRLYLNTPVFTDGGRVDPTPHFYAELSDEHGINTTGTGIGHDLLLVVDEDPNKTYVLNSYYTSDGNSYTSGKISFKMPQLSAGQHTLRFRAWDLLNNSSTRTLSFIVDDGKGTDIYSVYAPVSIVESNMTLTINYDRPDDLTQMQIGIYDLSGRCVWSQEQSGASKVSISLHDKGLSAGLYIYRVAVKMVNEKKYATNSGKIYITNKK